MSISNVNAALATYQYAVKAQKTSAKGTAFADKVTETEEADSTTDGHNSQNSQSEEEIRDKSVWPCNIW